MNGPTHLAKFKTIEDNNFNSEMVYRRCPFGNKKPPYLLLDMFLDIKWDDDLIKGLSVNRSKYSNPDDTLWSPISEDTINKICHYIEKKGLIFESATKHYPATDNATGVVFELIHSPINCNISHCDITSKNIPQDANKPLRRDIKAFLSTLFQELK
jgi:hypothetical protein